MTHLTSEQMKLYVKGLLTPEEEDSLRLHMWDCFDCRIESQLEYESLRASCPSELELIAYQQRLGNFQFLRNIEEHLKTCVFCSEDIKELTVAEVEWLFAEEAVAAQKEDTPSMLEGVLRFVASQGGWIIETVQGKYQTLRENIVYSLYGWNMRLQTVDVFSAKNGENHVISEWERPIELGGERKGAANVKISHNERLKPKPYVIEVELNFSLPPNAISWLYLKAANGQSPPRTVRGNYFKAEMGNYGKGRYQLILRTDRGEISFELPPLG